MYSNAEVEKIVAGFAYMPEAIVCSNDDIALKCIRALAKKGLKCPTDVAVTGFDNEEVLTQEGKCYEVEKDASTVNVVVTAHRSVIDLMKTRSGRYINTRRTASFNVHFYLSRNGRSRRIRFRQSTRYVIQTFKHQNRSSYRMLGPVFIGMIAVHISVDV